MPRPPAPTGQVRPYTSALAWIAGIASLIAVIWWFAYLLGGSRTAAPHAFYIPVLLAAYRFGLPGSVVTALVAGLVAGPLLPQDVAEGIEQEWPNWLARLGFLEAIGAAMAVALARARAIWAREFQLTQQEKDLAARKAAVIQSVSHEFRTPLTVLEGAVHTLDRHAMVSEAGKPLLASINRSVARLDELTSTVLAAAEVLGGDPRVQHRETVSVTQALQRVAADFRAPEWHRVDVQVPAEASEVTTNPDLFHTLLRVLVDNALKFSPEDQPVRLEAATSGDGIEIRIRDRGPGIPKRLLLGEPVPFAQGDSSETRAVGGLGMGLFVARHITGFLGGRLDFSTPPDGGTLATVWLPQRHPDETAT